MHRIHFAESSHFSDFVAKFHSLRLLDFGNIECSTGNALYWNQSPEELCTLDETGQCCVTLDGNSKMLVKHLIWVYSKSIPPELKRRMSFYSYVCNDVAGLLRSLGPLLTRLEIVSPGNWLVVLTFLILICIIFRKPHGRFYHFFPWYLYQLSDPASSLILPKPSD